jgi:hypothetical protein
MAQLKGPRSYPKVILILDQEWTIKFVRRIDIAVQGGYRVMGSCDSDERNISILLGLTPYETFVTFMHEVMHAMEYEYRFEIPHAKVLDKLDMAMAQFYLANNKEMRRIIS